MKSLQFAKKALLGFASIVTLAVPLIAGITIENTAVAQDEQTTQSNDPMLIVRIAPVYPPRAASQGIEGYVVVQYTVDATGSTTDLRVVESSSPLFDQAAVDSVRKYKYMPRVENGTPVATEGVMMRLNFALDGEGQPADAEQNG